MARRKAGQPASSLSESGKDESGKTNLGILRCQQLRVRTYSKICFNWRDVVKAKATRAYLRFPRMATLEEWNTLLLIQNVGLRTKNAWIPFWGSMKMPWRREGFTALHLEVL